METTPPIFDLTRTIDSEMDRVSISILKTVQKDGWNARMIEIYSHSGTHMDAPNHFIDEGGRIDRLDLTQCIGPALVVDLSPSQPRQLYTIDDLAPWADQIEQGSRILIRSGWSHRYGQDSFRDELPRIGEDLAHWLVNRGIAFIGVEPPSVADVNNIEELTRVHRILLEANIVIAEGLVNLEQLPQSVFVCALPMKIADGDGAPARIVAWPTSQPS